MDGKRLPQRLMAKHMVQMLRHLGELMPTDIYIYKHLLEQMWISCIEVCVCVCVCLCFVGVRRWQLRMGWKCSAVGREKLCAFYTIPRARRVSLRFGFTDGGRKEGRPNDWQRSATRMVLWIGSKGVCHPPRPSLFTAGLLRLAMLGHLYMSKFGRISTWSHSIQNE